MEEKERYEYHEVSNEVETYECYWDNQECCELFDDKAVLNRLNEQDYELKKLNQENIKLIKENQQLKQQLAITEKALELACEHIKEDLKCDDTENEIYNYFKTQAKEMLENE